MDLTFILEIELLRLIILNHFLYSWKTLKIKFKLIVDRENN